jgi:hypothetical protein
MYPDECIALFLTQREIAYLMAITPLLGWAATWRLTPGRDLPTTLPDDILPIDIQSEIEGKLMTTCTLTTELNRIAQAIDNIPNCCTSGGGGGAGTSTGTQDVDPPPVDNDTGQPAGWPDDVDYETYNCAAGNALINSISSIFERAMLNDLFNAEDAVQSGIPALVSILGLIIGVALSGLAGLVVGIVGVIAGLAVKLVTGGWTSQTIVDNLAANYDDLTCCLAAAQTKNGVISCFDTALGANSDDARIVGYLLQFGNMANWLFEYHPEIPASDCQCTQPTDCLDCEGGITLYPCSISVVGDGEPDWDDNCTNPQFQETGDIQSLVGANANGNYHVVCTGARGVTKRYQLNLDTSIQCTNRQLKIHITVSAGTSPARFVIYGGDQNEIFHGYPEVNDDHVTHTWTFDGAILNQFYPLIIQVDSRNCDDTQRSLTLHAVYVTTTYNSDYCTGDCIDSNT